MREYSPVPAKIANSPDSHNKLRRPRPCLVSREYCRHFRHRARDLPATQQWTAPVLWAAEPALKLAESTRRNTLSACRSNCGENFRDSRPLKSRCDAHCRFYRTQASFTEYRELPDRTQGTSWHKSRRAVPVGATRQAPRSAIQNSPTTRESFRAGHSVVQSA